MIDRAREYDDLTKHVVRKQHWLKVAKDLARKKGGAIKLLTLPGPYRFEVELYRSEGLFGQLGNQAVVVPVVGFETSPEVFGLLCTSEPKFEQLFMDDLIKTLIDANARHHRELLGCFPFDIINLDLTVNLVEQSEGPYGDVLRAVRECFKLQAAQVGEWALMLTFRAIPEETSAGTVGSLTKQYQENVDAHPEFRDACFHRFNAITAAKIFSDRPEEALGQFAAKWIVDQAHNFDLKVTSVSHVVYERKSARRQSGYYLMCKLIFKFRRLSLPSHTIPGKRVPEVGDHVRDILDVVRARQINVSELVEKLRESNPLYIEQLEAEIESIKAAR